ncbi:MAG TPA: isoprenylcysteine carboxylmethyltransferase family protein [Rhizomicrobium sp.]|nr:isoprenylcysteine carboxylmethyltransferase family protein [Rhizomicrobium sp.]
MRLADLDPDILNPHHALYWLWGVWYASWLLSLFWAGRPAKAVRSLSHVPYQLVTMAGIYLLFVEAAVNYAPHVLWQTSDQAGRVLFGLTALCFAFCWWARLTMGRLWSGFVSRLENHRIVDTGPFAIVRHPIYTGIIVASFLLAAEQGTAEGFAGAVCFVLAFWLKARVEEEFLRAELGPEPYDAYRRRVPMLVPLGSKYR